MRSPEFDEERLLEAQRRRNAERLIADTVFIAQLRELDRVRGAPSMRRETMAGVCLRALTAAPAVASRVAAANSASNTTHAEHAAIQGRSAQGKA